MCRPIRQPTLRPTDRLDVPPSSRTPHLAWVNTPVLLEALQRYEEGHLSPPLRLWLEALLELKGQASDSLRTWRRR